MRNVPPGAAKTPVGQKQLMLRQVKICATLALLSVSFASLDFSPYREGRQLLYPYPEYFL
ncbi:hypothetical protein COCMIDRAFT_107639 [Bipolaris oryzae ATCC 44560]|uniref:Uncharacterized protein n=1 Tax=Bipolaris oryzae ATCC 44560 TaxID=930090 RepID=W6YZD1_COCMI|nr:uncharacterized protein COCMIDRAFT_107639 [Bipolaris oryzae ATCC 44560]EUC40879.1 hypothetical protein COCMIDRAFT_107639 [Bipolaris oryzae ATCC 44560]